MAWSPTVAWWLAAYSSRLVKLTYLEFDLDRIFTDGLFPTSPSLPPAARLAPAAASSRRRQLAGALPPGLLDSGARIREGLSRAVEQAIRDFPTAFWPTRPTMRCARAVSTGKLQPDAYYQYLLRLIYRILS